MTGTNTSSKTTSLPRWRKWLHRGFLVWAIFSFSYLFSGFRTVGVEKGLLIGDTTISVTETAESIQFVPAVYDSALVFFCGAGVSARAYAPMLRPIADQGFAVFIIKLPYRLAPFASHKTEAVQRATQLMTNRSDVDRWIIAGHSLGGALAARVARDHADKITGLVLVGTTHPKIDDLSSLTIPATKVFGSNDGIAPVEKIIANKRLLPAHTEYILIEGGTHVQFGHYARQFLDGSPTIPRAEQQAITRTAMLELLNAVPE